MTMDVFEWSSTETLGCFPVYDFLEDFLVGHLDT